MFYQNHIANVGHLQMESKEYLERGCTVVFVAVNEEIGEYIALSKKMMRTIKWNLSFSMGLK